MRTRPDLLEDQAGAARGGRGWAVGGMLAALIVVLLSPLASADPDGLERVAEDLGFLDRGLDAPYQIFPDYTIPFLGETPASTIVAGLIGALAVAALAFGVARLIRRRPSQPAVKVERSAS
jgi:cobalt/nickel transport system permease protein